RGDISLVNWPQNDYMLGNFYEVTPDEAARNLDRAKQLSLSLLYWLQTEAPRPDGGTGWKGMRLRRTLAALKTGWRSILTFARAAASGRNSLSSSSRFPRTIV